jgi:hypothetical protein
MKLTVKSFLLSVYIVFVVLLLLPVAADAVRVNICLRSGDHEVEFGEVWLTTGYGEEIPGSRVDFSACGQFGPGQTKRLTTDDLDIAYPHGITDIHVGRYVADGGDYGPEDIGPPVSPNTWYPLPPDDTLGVMFEDATDVETYSWGEIKGLYK